MLKLGGLARQKLEVLRRFHIPASIIAGLIAWFMIRLFGVLEKLATGQSSYAQALFEFLNQWPGWLIALVFAGMLLQPSRSRSSSGRLSRVGREGLMVWVIVLGQTMVGLTVTWLFIQPFTDIPNSFGMLIETGFAGGHGTAAAMGQVFKHPSIQLDAGRDLGVLVATVGLVYGLATGVVWVNLGVRKGWMRQRVGEEDTSPESESTLLDGDSVNATQPVSLSDSAGRHDDVLSVDHHANVFYEKGRRFGTAFILLIAATCIGWGIHQGVNSIAASYEADSAIEGVSDGSKESVPHGVAVKKKPAVDPRSGGSVQAQGVLTINGEEEALLLAGEAELEKKLSFSAVISSFPLFIFTLFGGLLLRQLLVVIGRETLLDVTMIQSMTSLAMDLLVFAAIATLNFEVVQTFFGPLVVLLLAGFFWTGFCLLVLSRHLLPSDHWFELGLINYGMSTGVTATGFVLLRLVDPKLRSGAAEDYALAAPLSSPFVGGGMLTIGLPLLVLERVPISVVCVCLFLVVTALSCLGWYWNRNRPIP